MNLKENRSAFLEYFGDNPKLRFLDFLIGNYFWDFNMTDMAKQAGISYNSLKRFFNEYIEKGILLKTRKVGKSDMFKLNMDNTTSQMLVKFAWFLTKQDLAVIDPKNTFSISKESKIPAEKII